MDDLNLVLTFGTTYVYTKCSVCVLNLQFSCTELVIQWTIFCHIDARITTSEKDLPVTVPVGKSRLQNSSIGISVGKAADFAFD